MGKRFLSLLMVLCLSLSLVMPVVAAPGDNDSGESTTTTTGTAVYVSRDGSDETGTGSEESPYATLAKAVDAAGNGATICVMSDLTMTDSARFWNKHLTITSLNPDEPVTLTRGKDLSVVHDPARSNYNPAMIEVGGSSYTLESSLTLENIILDDAGLRGGDTSTDEKEDNVYFIQAASKSVEDTNYGKTIFVDLTISNTDIVQDAMIATYNNTATITLGDGAVLKNYGGMSAVRVSGGVLNMLDGSAIYDDLENFTRSKGSTIQGADKGLYGPAGAIWLQGGQFVMDEGAEICDMVGRAIYNEAGNVQANGTFANLTTSKNVMWQGNSGAVMHMRVKAKATFGPTSVINGGGATLDGNAIAVLGDCVLTMDEGSLVTGYKNGNVLDIGGTAYLNGEITGLTGSGHAICAQSSSNHYIQIGETGNIHDNVCSYGTIYTQGSNGVIDIYGKINNNLSTDRGGAVVLANNGTHVNVNMYEGAEMCGNVSTQTGGAVMVSCGTFTMHGGTISNNISGAGRSADDDAVGGGVFVRRGGTFIMKGGEITDNHAIGLGGGVAVIVEDFNDNVPYVELSGGTISGNDDKAAVTGNNTDGYQLEAAGTSNDITLIGGTTYSHVNRYFVTGSGLNLGNEQIYMADYGFYIDRIDDVKLGNAAAACEKAATDKYGVENYGYLGTVVGSFWYQSDSNVTLDISGLENATNYTADKPLFAAIVPTSQEGTPVEAGELELFALPGGGNFRLPLKGSTNGCAVVFLQENDASSIITVVPASLTAYMGGNGGYEGVVDGDGNTIEAESLPRPIFHITAPVGVDLNNLTFVNEESSNKWTLTEVGGGYYRFEPVEENGMPVRVQYSDGTTVVTEDDFQPIVDVYKDYTVTIYAGETAGKVQANATDQYYTVITGPGVLTVRAVADKDDPTSDVKDAVPTEKVPAGTAQAVEPADTTYTLNDTGVQLPVDSKPSLLFDDIIDTDVDRTSALEEKVDDFLGGANEKRHYEIKYLDLVDANNGNAWITSSAGTDIYWGYPDGTNQETEFTLLHFKGLHRDGQNSGYEVSDINSAIVETIEVVNTDNGIKFHVDAGGFSPFALVWDVAPTTYTIKASAGSGGSIDPVGDVSVTEGGTQTFTMQPASGYHIEGVWVDNQYVGTASTYTFSNVTANHTIHVDFDRNSPPITYYTITASAGEGGAINPSGTIRVPAGGDRTFTISAAEGYEIADVLVDGKSVGAVDSYTFENVRANHTISVVFQEASGIADPDDTGVSDWLDTDNHKVYLNGYPDDSFQPEKDMTRAEAAQMFYNLLRDQDVETTVSFTDVAADAWYATAVNALASLEIVNGVGDNRFSPERTITRAEFTTMAMRFCDGIPDGENIFSDVDQEDWFYAYVVGSIQYGWINGYPDGTFRPNDTISRAEVTTITNRMLGRAADEAFVDQHQDSLRIFTDLKDTHWAYYQIVEATNAHEYTKDNGTEDWTKLV